MPPELFPHLCAFGQAPCGDEQQVRIPFLQIPQAGEQLPAIGAGGGDEDQGCRAVAEVAAGHPVAVHVRQVDEHPLRSRRRAPPVERRLAHRRKAELPCLRFNAFRVGRVSGHQDQGHRSIRFVACPPAGPKQRGVLPRMQAAADDDDVAGAIAEPGAQGADFLRAGRRRREVVLHVSGDVEPLRVHSQASQASGVLPRLHRDERHGTQQRRDDSGPLMPPAGTQRHPAVQHDGRHAPPMQGEKKIRPQVAFDNDHQARLKAVQISVHDQGQVQGELDDSVPGKGASRGAETRGGKGGDYERSLRKVPLQPAHQRLEKQYLTGGGAVQPDGRRRAGAETETQAGHELPGFAPAHQAVEQPGQTRERRQQVSEIEQQGEQKLQTLRSGIGGGPRHYRRAPVDPLGAQCFNAGDEYTDRVAREQCFLSEEEFARRVRSCRTPFLRACEDMAIDADLEPWLRSMYLPLAAWLERAREKAGTSIVVGLTGGQGSGKSTVCVLLQTVLREGFGARAAVLSVDDLYLTHAERQRLGREVHPLFATRGPPGTHDPALGLATIERLLAQGPGERTALPSFDKAIDDRLSRSAWPVHEGSADYVLFEGWCVGARPQSKSALARPINALEREEDADGRWRGAVNAALAGPYRALFDRIDVEIMLRVEGMARVHEWRRLQEKKLRERVGREGTGGAPVRVMSDADLERFIAHYERITRHLLEEMPARADVVLEIDHHHQPAAVRINRPL